MPPRELDGRFENGRPFCLQVADLMCGLSLLLASPHPVSEGLEFPSHPEQLQPSICQCHPIGDGPERASSMRGAFSFSEPADCRSSFHAAWAG
jgi:hypothetical protein